MERAVFDRIMLLGRVALIEQIMVKLDVLLRREILQCSTTEALREALESYEGAARALEQTAFQDPELQLTDSERAMFADEWREMLQQLKVRTEAMFDSSD